MRRQDPASTALLYAYAVTPAQPSVRGPNGGITGIGGRPVRLLDGGGPGRGLAAAVSPVPASEFGEEPLARYLEDLDWLESTARAHHAVVERLGRTGAVLPLRMATVYRSEERVREVLAERAEEFTALLTRLAGHLEWGVKVSVPRGSPAPALRPEPAHAGAGGGRDYLRRRREARRAGEDSWQAAARIGERIDHEVAGLVAGARHYRPQDPRLTGTAGGPAGPVVNVVNAAYLVPERRADEFRALVQRLGAEDDRVRVDVIGPWAPYSFAAGVSAG